MKKRTKIIITLLIILLSIIILNNESKAAISIVPSPAGTGTDVLTMTTISNSFLQCQQMTRVGGTLSGTTVVPHLATNKEWGAVSYLSNSTYGTETKGGNTGERVEIKNANGVETSYYSTNGNLTGVMNWGCNPNKTYYTQTAGIISQYNTNPPSSNITAIYENRNTRYVDLIGSTTGMAMGETSGIYGSWAYSSTDKNNPCSLRYKLFGFVLGIAVNLDAYGPCDVFGSGDAFSNVTFRPVIWNQ